MDNENMENTLDERLDEIEAAIDNLSGDSDNVDENAGSARSAEDTGFSQEIESMRSIIDAQNATIDRKAKQMERMVMLYGARISDTSDGRGVEAFSVEPKLGNDLPDDTPNLEDIVLGS